jgi:hypothetical protein
MPPKENIILRNQRGIQKKDRKRIAHENRRTIPSSFETVLMKEN